MIRAEPFWTEVKAANTLNSNMKQEVSVVWWLPRCDESSCVSERDPRSDREVLGERVSGGGGGEAEGGEPKTEGQLLIAASSIVWIYICTQSLNLRERKSWERGRAEGEEELRQNSDWLLRSSAASPAAQELCEELRVKHLLTEWRHEFTSSAASCAWFMFLFRRNILSKE